MKEFSFKDLRTSMNIKSTAQLQPRNSSFGGRVTTETDQRIQMIRRKYDNPSPYVDRQMKKSHLDQSTPLRQSIAQNRSTIFEKNCQYILDGSSVSIKNSVSQQLKSQNQENILQKFHEMKQSILQDRNSTFSWNRLKLEKEKNEKIQKLTNEQQTNVNPRMQNIDKINSKIKHILSYLHLHDKQNLDQTDKMSYCNQQSRCSISQQSLKNSVKLDQSSFSRGNYISNVKYSENMQKNSEAKSYETQRSGNMSFSKKYNDNNTLKSYQSIEINTKNESLKDKQEQKTSLSHKEKISENQNRNFRKNGHQKLHSQSLKLQIESSQKKTLEKEIYVTNFDSKQPKNVVDTNKNQPEPTSGSQRMLNNMNCKSSRSKSYIHSKILNKFNKDDDCKSDISQKVDDEIKRIQKKIKDFEEEKRKLNIDFKPYDQNKKITIDNSSKSAYKNDYQPLIKRDKSVSYFKRQTQPIQNHSNFQLQPKRNSQTSNISPSLLQLRAKYKIDDQNQKNYIQEFEMRRKTDEGIEQRRRLLNSNKFGHKKQNNDVVKKLVQVLQQQVTLDQQYRNAKSWFTEQFDEQKWNHLQKELKKKQIFMNMYEMKNTFSLLQEQNNPFFSISECKQSYHSLAEKYKRAQQYWQQNIEKKFSRSQLQAEKFINNRIDLQKKGYIEVEDLVRFMNMETGTFSRNRDLIIIFKRFCSDSGKLTFEKMMRSICRQ